MIENVYEIGNHCYMICNLKEVTRATRELTREFIVYNCSLAFNEIKKERKKIYPDL